MDFFGRGLDLKTMKWPKSILFAISFFLISGLAGCANIFGSADSGASAPGVPLVSQEFLLNCQELNFSSLPSDPTTELPPEVEKNYLASYNRFRGLEVERFQLPPGADLPRSLVEICPDVFLFVNNLGRSFIFDAGNSKTYGFDELLVPRALIDSQEPFAEFFNTPERVDDLGLRDLLIHDSKIIFSSVEFNKEENCIATTLYNVEIDFLQNTFSKPKKIFQIEPCLSQIPGQRQEGLLNPSESGGRLQKYLDNSILLTTGPFAFGYSLINEEFVSTVTPYVEKYIDFEDSLYGAVLRIKNLDNDASAEVFARGFRNPQGLTVTPFGEIWLSDHGPAGGDELNYIEADKHYGWPFQTYGLPYDVGNSGKPWEINQFWSERYELESEIYEDPVFSWKPSVAPSEVVYYSNPEGEFKDFYGKLLVSTLRDTSIRIMTIKSGRVVIDSPILVNERIRDLAVSSKDGKIYALTDTSRILQISASDLTPVS